MASLVRINCPHFSIANQRNTAKIEEDVSASRPTEVRAQVVGSCYVIRSLILALNREDVLPKENTISIDIRDGISD